MQRPDSRLKIKFTMVIIENTDATSWRRMEWQKILPKARNVVVSVPGVPGISSSLKNAIKCGNSDIVTTLVSRNV